ncbi:GntR family transcriptional regulator [Rhizocola hellebori]|uniref:GntR family transcriptional regulator n=1 Tax=Rhizocola hellebori TaxID=1392758 RepID=UPI0019409319|nr:GntR family transcriptional regulator [Rhizocola hellebori]
MNIAVSRELGIPLGTQVRDQIVVAISKGDLVPGDRLPTIRQLADFLDLNRNTIAQVYRTLEQEGYLSTRGGGGTSVADTSATRTAVRMQELHQLLREALHAAERKGFTAREFSEVALYEAAQWQALRHKAFLVVDEYQGELEYLSHAIRRLMPGAIVHSILLSDLVKQGTPNVGSMPEADFALVPFYCLERARAALLASGIPVMAAGIGPSVATIRHIAEQARGKDVAIVCTEPAGPPYMERAMRHARIKFRRTRHAFLGQPDFDEVVEASDVIVASEGSAESVGRRAGTKPVLVFSALLDEETLVAIHQYTETLANADNEG